eukprot:1602441-Rhodomonas_salina.3
MAVPLCYEMSDTEIGYAAIIVPHTLSSYATATRCPVLSCAMLLTLCYAKPGTELSSAVPLCYAKPGTELAMLLPDASPGFRRGTRQSDAGHVTCPITLRAPYAMSRTDKAYGVGGLCDVLYCHSECC